MRSQDERPACRPFILQTERKLVSIFVGSESYVVLKRIDMTLIEVAT